MKHLLLLASLFTIFLFLSGCQTDTPVSPDGDFTLEKPIKPNTITGKLIANPGNNCMVLQVEWLPIRNALEYNVVIAGDTTVVYSPYVFIDNVAAVEPGAEVTVEIIAKGERKNGTSYVMASGTKAFTYTYFPNIVLTGNYTLSTYDYLDLLVLWDAVQDAVTYHCSNYISYSGEIYTDDHTYINWSMGNVNPIIPGVYNIITIEAINSSGTVIATGAKTFTYTP